MRPSRAVRLDMDGVIVDSEPRHEKVFLDGVHEVGCGDKLALRFTGYIGRTDEDLWTDFIAVVTSSKVERGKPAPDIFLPTRQLFNVGPASCCVIEDSKSGIAGSLAAGMQVSAIY